MTNRHKFIGWARELQRWPEMGEGASHGSETAARASESAARNNALDFALPEKTIVLVGLMGAGKTSVGKRLAARLGRPFVDADAEVEAAAGGSVAEIFARLGEAAFRDGERRVMARLLDGQPSVLAAGGGAFIDPATRALVAAKGISLWLRADLEILVRRTQGRDHRPLLNAGNPKDVLKKMIDV